MMSVEESHLQKSNKWDATKDVLMADQRLEALTELQRTPRSYKKRLMNIGQLAFEKTVKSVPDCATRKLTIALRIVMSLRVCPPSHQIFYDHD